MDKSNMLIDFSSPAYKKDLAIPLIPVPPLIPTEKIDEPSADPFEVQEIAASDPFEAVLQQVGNNLNNERIAAEEPQLSINCKSEKILIHFQSEDSDSNKTPEKNVEPVSSFSPDNVANKTPLENDQVLSKNETLEDCKVVPEKTLNISLDHNKAQCTLKNSPKLSVTMESESQSQISADFSTEENLKAVIAKRVNRCIQEVLNGSKKTNTKSLLKKPQNKRSLSFIELPSEPAKKECDRLNKSCSVVNDTFNLENEQLNVSSDSSGFGLLSSTSTDVSADEDQVFKEARKLSRTISKIAESFRQEQESDSDDEDLLSCKPRWLYTESSEDEEEKLLKDPALNFRRRSDSQTFSSPAPQPTAPKVSDSPALLAYKSRRSFTQLQAALNITQEEVTLKRSVSVGSHLREVPVIPTIVSAGPINLRKAEAQSIKLRKNIGDVKKGPLRAVMPIQSMTKEPLPIIGKISSKQNTSPEARIQNSIHELKTPNKDNSQLNIAPMASSTPNKSEVFMTSKVNTSLLMKPMASVAANKRHSLEGDFGSSHKSRGVVSEGGARPRSNSASSSIPRVMQVKPLRGPLVPKSTSNLGRAITQINSNNVKNIPEKKNLSLKSNISKARVLADVKTKSPRQSKVRTAVNTISNLVRGKKTAARDKENRVPA